MFENFQTILFFLTLYPSLSTSLSIMLLTTSELPKIPSTRNTKVSHSFSSSSIPTTITLSTNPRQVIITIGISLTVKST